jgi:hypothetical protein
MQPVSSVGAATAADTATTTNDATANVAPDTTFHDALATATERLQPVQGHHYAKVVAGAREGEYVNRSHNERHGEAFTLVRRAGRVFHLYGTGADRVVVELPSAAKDAAAKADQAAPETTGGSQAQ